MTLESSLPATVAGREKLARFVRQSRYAKGGRIRHDTFTPAPDNDTSVFRIEGLETEEIKALAVEHVRERSKNGAAVFLASAVKKAKLILEVKEPPPRHANIRGWSLNEDKELKTSERKLAAMVLAEESSHLAW
ncbi:MAG: hypothetical protein ACSHYB_14550 [Roseibacillus sp.]